ncbi:MAG: SDR family oxidoreductase [Cytophagales bacterium]|nr:SDR family oxidoreductase [Bernardetiaceae bacterium]MDW8204953.1 SDR family oxidoreductase [Cytophagales bacterium]
MSQVIWITGASSGIGEALAYAFAKQPDVQLILSARREAELQRVAQATRLPQERLLVLPLDLSQGDTLPQKAQQALSHFGKVDIMVHNGGVSQRALAKDTLVTVDRIIMETNFFGALILTKALLPSMLARKSGRFVVISSSVGKFGTPLRSTYAASKHALHGFFDSLRAECWRENIKVLMVCPGYIRTQVSVNAFLGTGEKQGTMDEAQAKGIPAEVCAERIIAAIRADKEEINIAGAKEMLGIYLKRFFPSLFSKLVRQIKVT